MKKLEVNGMPRAYIIRNSRIDPEWKTVRSRIVPIAGRTIDSLIRTQGFGDMCRIYHSALKEGIDFNLAFIPDEFNLKAKELFDPEYMGKLFNLGYRMALSGYPWEKTPPGY